VQIAIVSWGVGTSDCGDPRVPVIYSLVASARAFVEALVPTAQFESWPSIAEDDPCACADDCLSNGFNVSSRCGCADHVGDGQPFCYVRSDACYPGAGHSVFVFGALFRPCVLPSPPPLPPGTARSPLLPPAQPSEELFSPSQPPPRAPPTMPAPEQPAQSAGSSWSGVFLVAGVAIVAAGLLATVCAARQQSSQ
jgi:hypothetical protein